jgi:hypothetical protein
MTARKSDRLLGKATCPPRPWRALTAALRRGANADVAMELIILLGVFMYTTFRVKTWV